MDSTRAALESRNTGGHRNAGILKPNTLSTLRTRFSTIPNQVNVFEAAQRLRRNVAATLPIDTSRCYGLLTVGICG
jgi:hypothetical protein